MDTKLSTLLNSPPANALGAEDTLEGAYSDEPVEGFSSTAAEVPSGTSVNDLYWFYGNGGTATEASDSGTSGHEPDGGSDDSDGAGVAVIKLDRMDVAGEVTVVADTENIRFAFSTDLADVNGDGYADLIAGTFDITPNNGMQPGSVYVIFGSADGIPSNVDVAALDGTDGFRIDGRAAGDCTGYSVSGGDVNGDGLADIVFGAHGADPNGSSSGAAYVIYGATGFAPSMQVSDLDGTNGFVISGVAAGDGAGHEVKVVGDLNGDGYGEILVSAAGASPNGEHSGAVHVVYGAAGGMPRNVELSALDGTTGFRIEGGSEGANFGWSVDSGDVNGDGFEDLAIGARWEDYYAGSTYVLFGSSSGFGPDVDLATLDGSDGFRISGVPFYEYGVDHNVGYSVCMGDINGDGYDDVIVGSKNWGADYEGDTSFVIFGRADGFAPELSVADIDGSQGFRLDGAWTGAAGDVNGDGIDDAILGSADSDPGGHWSGAIYVVFGSTDGFEPDIDLWRLEDFNGLLLAGGEGDLIGLSASAAGDVNGDGYDDLSIHAGGAAYIFYGRDFSLLDTDATPV